MAEDCTDGDYLGAYSRFFAEFVERVNPNDQLPVSVSAYNMTEGEIVGGIISVTLQYLNQTHCPPSLQAHVVHQVIQEIQTMCKKQPEECGLRPQDKTYAPLQLMRAVTSKVNEICTRYLDNSRLALLPPPPSSPLPQIEAGGQKNGRRTMEDRHVVLHDLHTIFSIQDDSIANYYAVFDGHGGQDAAVYCATHLHQYLAESIHYPTDPERALRDAFLTTDAQFIEKSKRQKVHGGSTAICTLLVRKKLYVAWAGDSAAILVRRGHITNLVNLHRLNRADEVQRIQDMGGLVMCNMGVMRVNGMLEISRAIGDVQCKPFVTGEPETKCIPLDGTEDFMVIASDGLWDVMSPSDVTTMLYQEIHRRPNALKSVHQSLLQRAKRKGSTDNITIILVFLTPACEIAERPLTAYPILNNKPKPNDPMNNMDPNNPFLSNANGLHETANGAYIKQVPHLQHLQHLQHEQNGAEQMDQMNQMDDNHIIYETSSNGKHENGDADYDYSDLGPETNVDTIDDVLVPSAPTKNLQYELYAADADDDDDDDDDDDEDDNDDSSQDGEVKRQPQKPCLLDDNRMEVEQDVQMIEFGSKTQDEEHNDDELLGNRELEILNANYTPLADDRQQDTTNKETNLLGEAMGDTIDHAALLDYEKAPVSPQDTKPLQHALIPEADNVADSEESEDEWNYYRVDPNKQKDSVAVVDEQPETQKEKEKAPSPQPADEDITPGIQSPEVECGVRCESPAEELSPEHIDTKQSSATVEEKEEKQETKTFADQQETEGDMDFHLNPEAAEFFPGSPQSIGTRLNLTEDYPLAGSPLKQISQMDDIQVPSQSEFEQEVCRRPREMEDEEKEECTNGVDVQRTEDDTDFMMDKQKTVGSTGNLDDSEISSTKAEFGDESASFLTAPEFHRTGVSIVDDSFANSERDYHIANDPMAMSFTPSDFEAAFDKGVDLNAVHDLTGVQMEDKGDASSEDEDQISAPEKQSELNGLPPLETENTLLTPEQEKDTEEPAQLEQTDILQKSESQLNEKEETLSDHGFNEDTKVQEEQQPFEMLEEREETKFEQSPLTDHYSPESESEKEPVSVDNEQLLSPASIDIDATKPIDEANDDALLVAIDSEKDSNLKDEDTPSSLSPVPDVMECKTPEKDHDLISSMRNVQISSTPIASKLDWNSSEFASRQYNQYDQYMSECDMPSSTNAEPEEAKPMDVEEEHAHVEEEKEIIPEPIESSEVYAQEERKEMLVDLEDEPEVCTKSPVQSTGADLTPPLSPHETEKGAAGNAMYGIMLCPMYSKPEDEEQKVRECLEEHTRVDVYELKTEREDPTPLDVADLEIKHETPGLNLSESMQEFTGLEKQLEPEDPTPVETKPVEIVEPELPKQEEPKEIEEPKEVEELKEVEEPKEVEVHREPSPIVAPPEKAEILIPEIAPERTEPETEKEKVEVLEKEQIKENLSIGGTVAAVVAVTAVAASATAAATAPKAKAKLAAKTTKTAPKTIAKPSPASPSKTASATARATATAITKRPTSSITSRAKESEATKKPSTTATAISKSTASKPAAIPKTTSTTAKTITRTSLTAAKPKPSTVSSKPVTATTDKKPTANGEVKSPSKSVPLKTTSKPLATTSTATKTTTTKSSTLTRTTIGGTATKTRPVSAATNTKTSTVKSSTSTSSTTTTSAARPKTAPITCTTAKPRVSTTAKSPLIDKQVKETANKQISARTSQSSASKTTSRSLTSSTTSTTAKRVSASKTVTSTSSPTKKATSSTKVSGRISSTTKTGNSVTKITKVVQNGVSETEITSTTIIPTNNKIEDDIPKKDLSPVVAPTDNQLIMTSD